MPGYSPKLPLVQDPGDGILLNKTYNEVAKQNLKMLLLTVPGERIMEPEFGVGLPTFFFENITPLTLQKIEQKTVEQIAKYLPYIILHEINLGSDQKALLDENTISMTIYYEVENVGIIDELIINIPIDPAII